MTKGLILSLILVACWFLAHIVVVHTFRPLRIFNVMTLLYAVTFPALALLYAATPSDLYILPENLTRTPTGLGVANGMLVHLLLYFTSMEVFYYVDRPVTFRLLVEFVKAPEGYLTLPEIRDACSLDEMITSRLRIMRMNGYLEEKEGRYILTPKGIVFAKVIHLIRRVLGVPYYFDVVPPKAV